MTNLENRIRTVLAQVFDLDEDAVNETTSSETVPQWDSLRHIKVIMLLEKNLNVSIRLDYIPTMSSFSRIRDVLSTMID